MRLGKRIAAKSEKGKSETEKTRGLDEERGDSRLTLLLHGCDGRMGRTLAELISQKENISVLVGINRSGGENPYFPIYTDLSMLNGLEERPDAAIDFSHHSAVPSLLDWCQTSDTPAVIATTALTDEEQEAVVRASQIIPVFQSSNMSIGINLLAQMAAAAIPLLEQSFYTEIIEKHHSQKKDSPSGTALLLADAINQACSVKKRYLYGRHGRQDECSIAELGIHAVRGGTIPGEHTILFAGQDELIELKHTALSPVIFAEGALSAARFLKGKDPGLYSMSDLIGR